MNWLKSKKSACTHAHKLQEEKQVNDFRFSIYDWRFENTKNAVILSGVEGHKQHYKSTSTTLSVTGK